MSSSFFALCFVPFLAFMIIIMCCLCFSFCLLHTNNICIGHQCLDLSHMIISIYVGWCSTYTYRSTVTLEVAGQPIFIRRQRKCCVVVHAIVVVSMNRLQCLRDNSRRLSMQECCLRRSSAQNQFWSCFFGSNGFKFRILNRQQQRNDDWTVKC